MRAAQIGLGEGREDRSVLLAASEIDVAQEAAEQPGGVQLSAVIGGPLESEARNRQRFAGLLHRLHGAIEIAPERRRVEQAGIRIDDTLGLERFQDALELTLERLQAHEWKDSLDQADGGGIEPALKW